MPNYYRMELPDGTLDSRPEDVLVRIESGAASAVARVATGEEVYEEARAWLALFIAIQHRRTPVGREWMGFFDGLIQTELTEVRFSHAEKFHEQARQVDPALTADEVKQFRVEMLADIQAGRVRMLSTPSREVGSLFVALDRVAQGLLEDMPWTVVRSPVGYEFVLPGLGVTLYDPTPPYPESGLGFASSPNTETVLAVDPAFALMLSPGSPVWRLVEADAAQMRELNLRAYAWSDVAVYGRSQRVVADLRVLARREAVRLAKLRPRSGRVWITEVDGGCRRGGEHEFTGHGPDGRSTRDSLSTRTLSKTPRRARPPLGSSALRSGSAPTTPRRAPLRYGRRSTRRRPSQVRGDLR
jgi:Protein of unknown function (DUF4238)